MHMSQQFDFDF